MSRYSWDELSIDKFNGRTFTTIEGLVKRSEEVVFTSDDGEVYYMYHDQDCCEDVELEDVCGEVSDLLNTPITNAWENTNSDGTEYGSYTYTFYVLGTKNGSVTIRWCGSSNGYYSESVSIKRKQN